MIIDLLAHHPSLIDEIARLKFLEFSHMVPGKTLEEFVERMHKHCNRDQFPITWVAIENNKFVGTFSLRVCDLESHSHFAPWLASLVVVPEKRKQGIGRTLVKTAENKAMMMGYRTLYLFTPNKAPWYSKLGWNPIELSSLNSVPITIMQKHVVKPL